MNDLSPASKTDPHLISLKEFLVVDLCLFALGYYLVAFSQLNPSPAYDFAVYYTDGLALRQHLNPYAPARFAAARSR